MPAGRPDERLYAALGITVREVIGMRVTVNKLAEVACPLLFGALGTAVGVSQVFAANSVLLAGGGMLNRRSEVE